MMYHTLHTEFDSSTQRNIACAIGLLFALAHLKNRVFILTGENWNNVAKEGDEQNRCVNSLVVDGVIENGHNRVISRKELVLLLYYVHIARQW